MRRIRQKEKKMMRKINRQKSFASAVAVCILFIGFWISPIRAGVLEQLENMFAQKQAAEPAFAFSPAPHLPYFNLDPFHFLEPLAPDAGDPTKFDRSLLDYLKVEVCVVTAGDCQIIKTFTSQSPSAERLRIERTGNRETYYLVNWDTLAYRLPNQNIYRIRVTLSNLELGSIDIAPDRQATLGRTIPIKFIVEKDAKLWVHVLSTNGATIWDVADALRSELGICGDELRQILLSNYPGTTDAQVGQVVNGVCQEVILPATTKITDTATRNALASFDMSTGSMVFAYETPLLKNLKINDVLVSKPSAAAPFGYLRKVTSIQKSRGTYLIESVQSSLTEVIHKGTLDASGDLFPSDELQSIPLTANSASRSSESKIADDDVQPFNSLSTGCVNSSGNTGYNFECNVDETFDQNLGEGEFEGTGHVRVAGKVYFNAGYDVGVGAEFCTRNVLLTCVDRFEARLRVRQKSELHVEGTLDARLHKEIVVARKIFEPITFWIGPVPVVVFPVVNLVVGARGDAHVEFSFDATSEASLAVGAKWTDPDDGGVGWQNVSEADVTGNANASLAGSLDLRGYYKGNAKLLLYGIAGPSFGGALGGRARFQIPAPPGQPVWSIYGRADGDLLFELTIIDAISLTRFTVDEFLMEQVELKRSPNFPPQCTHRDSVIDVNISQTIRLGPTSGGYFDCLDPEGDPISYSFTPNSSTGDIINQAAHTVTFGLPVNEVHSFTIRATDSNGGAAPPFTLSFNVINPPPEVEVNVATLTVPVGVQYFVNALAFDPDQRVYLRCTRESPTGQQTRFEFLVNPPHTSRKIGDGFNCSAEVIFREIGIQRITVMATDYLGATTPYYVDVNVTPAPADNPPKIDVSSISFSAVASQTFTLNSGTTLYVCLKDQPCSIPSGQSVSGGPSSLSALYKLPFYMSLSASDQDGTTPTVTWYCRDSFGAVALATPVGGGVYSCNSFGPARDVFIGATVSDGTTTVFSEIRKYVMTPLSNPN